MHLNSKFYCVQNCLFQIPQVPLNQTKLKLIPTGFEKNKQIEMSHSFCATLIRPSNLLHSGSVVRRGSHYARRLQTDTTTEKRNTDKGRVRNVPWTQSDMAASMESHEWVHQFLIYFNSIYIMNYLMLPLKFALNISNIIVTQTSGAICDASKNSRRAPPAEQHNLNCLVWGSRPAQDLTTKTFLLNRMVGSSTRAIQ